MLQKLKKKYWNHPKQQEAIGRFCHVLSTATIIGSGMILVRGALSMKIIIKAGLLIVTAFWFKKSAEQGLTVAQYNMGPTTSRATVLRKMISKP